MHVGTIWIDGLLALLDTIERADQLVNQVATVINYLTSDLKNVGEALETARHKQEFGIQNYPGTGRRAQKAFP